MESLTLEVPRTPGDTGRGFAYVAAIVLVSLGLGFSLSKGSIVPLIATVSGIAIYAWLLQSQPVATYLPYLIVDDRGVTYFHAPGVGTRTTFCAWSNISGAVASLGGRDGYDGPAIILKTQSGSSHWPMSSTGDCHLACQTIQANLNAKKVPFEIV